jgi:hypothetical protein
LLDSITFKYGTSSNTISRTTVFVYDKSNKVENEIYRTIQKTTPYLYLDTLIYSIVGSDVFRKYGVRGTNDKIGAINSEGYLLPIPRMYTVNTSKITILGVVYTDTSAYGDLSRNLNSKGQYTSLVVKNYNTYFSNTFYPLSRNIYSNQQSIAYIYDDKGLSEYTSETYIFNKKETKSSAVSAWQWQYVSVNLNGISYTSPAYSKNVIKYTYTDTKDFAPEYYYLIPEQYIAKEISTKKSNSINNVNWTIVSDGISNYTKNLVVENNRIISYDYLNPDGTLVYTKQYYYHKK